MQRYKVETGASSSVAVCQSLYFYVFFCKSSSRFQLVQVQPKLRDALFVRVWHHSWAVVVISRSAPCVSAEVDPLPTVCCICICLRQRDAHTDPNSGFFSSFFVSSVLCLDFFCCSSSQLNVDALRCLNTEILLVSFECLFQQTHTHTHTHGLTFTPLLVHTRTIFDRKLAAPLLWGNH